MVTITGGRRQSGSPGKGRRTYYPHGRIVPRTPLCNLGAGSRALPLRETGQRGRGTRGSKHQRGGGEGGRGSKRTWQPPALQGRDRGPPFPGNLAASEPSSGPAPSLPRGALTWPRHLSRCCAGAQGGVFLPVGGGGSQAAWFQGKS